MECPSLTLMASSRLKLGYKMVQSDRTSVRRRTAVRSRRRRGKDCYGRWKSRMRGGRAACVYCALAYKWSKCFTREPTQEGSSEAQMLCTRYSCSGGEYKEGQEQVSSSRSLALSSAAPRRLDTYRISCCRKSLESITLVADVCEQQRGRERK